MSVNQNHDHVLVLPEDRANLQIANGFHMQVPWNRQRQMQVLSAARGWIRVLELFRSVHVAEMERNPHRLMILLIDCDSREERLSDAKARVPEHLGDRVFILGALTNPESLRAELGSYETIGLKLAKDCREDANHIWGHRLLRHNVSEVSRLRRYVRPILFPPSEQP